ncbi:MAG: hypothetical protein WBC69_16775 [Geitlerinemataceae cyanobacterium]
MFDNFNDSSFGSLEVAFRVEELLAQEDEFAGGGIGERIGEFAVDNFYGFSFGGDIWVLLL